MIFTWAPFEMSDFGQRGRQDRKFKSLEPQKIGEMRDVLTDAARATNKPPVPWHVIGAGAVVAVLVGTIGFGFMMMSVGTQVASALGTPSTSHIFSAGARDFGFVFVPPDRRDGISQLDQGLTSTCVPNVANVFKAQREYELSRKIEPGPHPKFKLNYARASLFLTCAAKEQRERFCKPYYRARYISWVRDLIRMREREARFFDEEQVRLGELFDRLEALRSPDATRGMNRAAMARHERRLKTVRKRIEGVSTPEKDFDMTRSQLAQMDPALVSAIGALSRSGHITADDYGWRGLNSIPAAFRAVVVQPEAALSCRS